MAESEESLQLKRRARRRLVGAIALVTFVVIILPLLLDKEPGPSGPPLDVQIPRPESGGLASRMVPPAALPPAASAPSPEKRAEAPAAKLEPSSTETAAARAEPSALKSASAGPKAQAVPAAADKGAEVPTRAGANSNQEHAQAALHDEAWVVALDAFADAKNVTQLRTKLSAAGVKSYTEAVQTSKGELTRVRAGPFGSKEAAEKARAKLVEMGLKPGAVASR
jgi:DedD protein